MRIQHNITAMNSYRNYTANTKAVAKNLEKLSSGYRINRAGDDAAGLAISEKMRAQITGLETAQKNAKDGISLVQTAEGALTEVHSMLNRMVELAEQSANGTYDEAVDRANLQKEISSLSAEIDRIADSVNFNGLNLLDGSLGVTAEVTEGTATTWAAGEAAATAGTATVTELDFSKLSSNFMAGATVTVGGEAFEFVATGGTVTTTGATAVTLGTDKETSLTALATAIAANTELTDAAGDYGVATAAAANGVITVTSAVPPDPAAAGDPDTAAYSGVSMETSGIGLTLQIGDTADSFNKLTVSIKDMHTDALGLGAISVATQSGGAEAMTAIKDAINYVSSVRGDLGATQNRLDHTINNLSVMTENIQDAESSIRDVDVAEEMMEYTKNNILVQSAQAMLAQANQLPQGVLQLLQ